MSSNAIKIIAAILVVLAIVLVGFAYHLSRKYASQAQVQQQTQQAAQIAAKAQVVVAAKPLAANQPITSDEVRLVPVEIAPANYYSNVDDVINRVPMLDIDAGTPIVPRFFKQISILARDIPPGDRAVALRIDDVIGVGGFVKPGDIVDVVLYLRGNTGNDVKTQARLLLRNAKVLAYQDTVIEPPSNLKKKQNQRPKHQHTAVLAVPEKDVTRVMLGASLGELRLALQGSADSESQVASAGTAAAPATVGSLPPATPKRSDKRVSPLIAAIRAQQPITAAELAQLAPPKNARKLPPRVPIYSGDKVQLVRP